uniref:Uncharacterized protein n=1 Tax=Oryza sativa subsp. japonica TaxID=39947 RepID=Q2QMZ9_ORYSJ|nr:hypothetical protein LOC_Os12g39460 [Oryza sativa Japonica Group]
MVAAPSSAWQDLPTDLLVLVLLRFPSLTDRARLRTMLSVFSASSMMILNSRLKCCLVLGHYYVQYVYLPSYHC